MTNLPLTRFIKYNGFYRFFYKLYFLKKEQPVIITGVSGSGKSAVCKELKKCGYKAIDLDEIDGLYFIKHILSGKIVPGPLDLTLESIQQHKMLINEGLLKKIVIENSDDLVFYCGNLLEANHLYSMFKKIYLLKVNDDVNIDRLKTRPGNFWQNVEVHKWLLHSKKLLEALICKHCPILINANQNINIVMTDILTSYRYRT